MNDQDQQQSPPVGVTPYLTLSPATEASEFYQRAFGARELHRQTADDGQRLLHCHLEINGGSLMLSDAFPEYGHAQQQPASFTLHLQVDDVETWWERAVNAGAIVTMELADQFWGDRYGRLRDPFGVEWSLGASNQR